MTHGIRVGHDGLGRPDFDVAGELRDWPAARRIGRVHLPLGEPRQHVVAFGVAEGW